MADDSLAKAVARLLRLAPDSWADVPEDFASDENAALDAITAAGFVERRITFTVRLPGEEQAQRIVVEATGEFGLADAMQAVVQDWWARWGQRWRELRQEAGEPVKPILARQRDEWRLTDQGRLAKADLERGEQRPIDFALKRGFFDGTPRLLPDGRVTRREPVRGQGRLVKIENAASGPLTVDIAGFSAAGELAQAFAKAMEPFIKAAPPAEPEKPAAEYVFARDGDGWLVRAFGEQGHFRNLRGLEYIAKLLEYPGEPVLMAYLVGGLAGTMTAADAEEHGLHAQGAPQPKADVEALTKLRRQIAECKRGIEDALREGDTVGAEAMERECEILQSELDALTRPGGQSKAFGADTDKLRVAIYRALERAYAALRKGQMPKTANHLEAAISAQGDCYIYRPESRQEWTAKM